MDEIKNTFNLATIIVNYELPDITLDCIKSVLNSSLKPDQIILVDNGSNDDSAEIIRNTYPELDVYQLPKNYGFAGGFNFGIQIAQRSKASHIFLLNNDTWVDPFAIEELVRSDWDIAAPKILFYDSPNIIQSAGAHWRTFPPSVILNGLNKPDGLLRYNIPRKIQYASGCALLVKRDVFDNLGGFDLDYENYVEDYDFCYRATTNGYQIGYVPTARVLHKDSLTGGKNPKRRRLFIGRNTVLFYYKNHRFPAWKLVSFITWILLRETIKGNITHLPDYWTGFIDGFTFLRKTKPEG